MTVYDVLQRTPEWFALRCGRLTGSCAADMLATIKSGEAAARRDLRLRLVCERLTGIAQEDGYVNGAMQRGIDCEPLARAAYEAHTGLLVSEVGFLAHDELLAGCSPDGLVEDGLLEVKCPKSATHLRYLRQTHVPPEYLPQVLHTLWVSGAAWCDFVSWDGRFPAPLDFVVRRVVSTDVDLRAYELTVRLFLREVEAELDQVRGLCAMTS